MILLLGACGLERLADPLRRRTGAEVTVAAWTQVDLAARLRPDLVYVDLFGWDAVAPLTSAAVAGRPLPTPDLGPLRTVVASLRDTPVVYRGLRRPLPLGPLDRDPALDAALDALESVVTGERVLPVSALWARAGLVPDEVAYGLGHGEAGPSAAEVEARALHALWHAKVRGPVKVVVVDLDDTLVHGEVAAPDFAARNPAYAPEGEGAATPVEGWWRLRRGLHEALRVVRGRGVLLALATRNDPDVVARRFRKRPPAPADGAGAYAWMYDPLPDGVRRAALDAHPATLDALALGPEDFVVVEAGFGPKSEMCRRIAARLGVGSDTLAFLDDSAVERAEVRANAPEVHVLEGEVDGFREALLHEAPFVVWARTDATGLREASYRSRAAVAEVPPSDLAAFLHGLGLRAGVRPAEPGDLPRVRELFARATQLDLNGVRPTLATADGVWVGWCRDRLADHGLVAAGVFADGRLVAWVASCRVLPHRVAGTLLRAMLDAVPGSVAERVPTGRNGATVGLLEEGRAPWVTLER